MSILTLLPSSLELKNHSYVDGAAALKREERRTSSIGMSFLPVVNPSKYRSASWFLDFGRWGEAESYPKCCLPD